MAGLEQPDTAIADWIIERLPACGIDRASQLAVTGLLHGLTEERRDRMARRLLEALTGHDDLHLLAFLRVLPFGPKTWGLADELNGAIARRYWETIPSVWCRDVGEATTAAERLLAVGRSCAAFQALEFFLEAVPIPLLLQVLTAVLHTSEPPETIRQHEAYHIGEALTRLAAAPSVDDDAVITLEFNFWPLLRHHGDGSQRIHQRMARDSAFFIDLLRWVHKADHGTGEGVPDKRDARKHAFDILFDWRHVPGTQADGNMDEQAFAEWVKQALSMAAEQGLERAAQSRIGEVLAHAPADADGLWPCSAIRDVLDHPDHDVMREGLRCGLFNKRGVTSRSLDEGGMQERGLAAQYRGWADGLATSHWLLAEVLNDLANGYDRQAKSEDITAAKNCEE